MVGALLLAAAGCSDSGQESSSSSTVQRDKIAEQSSETVAPEQDAVQANDQFWVSSTKFTGTIEEYTVALQACMRDKGFETVPGEEPGQLDIGMVGHSDDDAFNAMENCRADVGEPNAHLTREELRDRYEWRVRQFECLVEEGFVTGSAKSFESFVADYQRTGLAEWDPIGSVVDGHTQLTEMLQVCPRENHW